jgi:hypothetical protein
MNGGVDVFIAAAASLSAAGLPFRVGGPMAAPDAIADRAHHDVGHLQYVGHLRPPS